MNSFKFIPLLAFFLFLCLSIEGCNDGGGDSAPADISGTWSGTVTAGSNIFALAVVLHQTGGNLTGNYATNFGGSTINGTLQGTYSNGNADIAFNYSGFTIANAALTFSGSKATGQITSIIAEESGTVNLVKE